MSKFQFLDCFINSYKKDIFFSMVKHSNRGYFVKRDYYSLKGITYLPMNKQFVEKGMALIVPKIEKSTYILCNFYNLKPYTLRALDYDELLATCKDFFTDLAGIEILERKNGQTIVAVYTSYSTTHYYAYTCHITDNILLSVLDKDGLFTSIPIGTYSMYNNIYDKVKDTEYETLSYQEIAANLCVYMNTHYSVPAPKDYNDTGKAYILDSDYDFLDDKSIDIINDMIDDELAEIRFLGSSDLLYVHIIEQNIPALFTKYSIEDICVLERVNTKIGDIYLKSISRGSLK